MNSPSPPDRDALLAAGKDNMNAGQLAEAERNFQRLLEYAPDDPDAMHLLGLIRSATGNHEEAVNYLEKAISGAPPNEDYLFNLGQIHQLTSKFADASACFRKALDIKPDYTEAHFNLGNALKGQGQLEDAVTSYQNALAIKPDFTQAHYNLGLSFHELGRLEDAALHYDKAIALEPDFAQAHYSLANALRELGRVQEAAANYGKFLALEPDFAEAHVALGNVLREQDRLEEATASYHKALALEPDYAEAHLNLGVALGKQDRLVDAAASYRKALALKPDFAEGHYNLGTVLKKQGLMEDAAASYQEALAVKPDFALAHSNLLVTMPFMSSFSGAAVLAQARRTGAAFEAQFADRLARRHANNLDPERRLHVGYLAPALTGHTLSNHIEPVLKAHRREHVSAHVYAHVPKPDAVTRRLKDLADEWTFVHELSDDQVAASIVEDGIDILVDPMGHWANNRLSVFARKPAPIQVSYLCQGLTTGLAAMDYAIGDRWLNLDGAMQAFATEQVVELPSGFQVIAYDKDLPCGEVPSAAAGFVTFASFNNPAKLSDACLRLWAAVLDAQPTARLLLKGQGLDQPEESALMTQRLADHGVAAGRVDLRGHIPGPDHLALYNLADIALDTTPFAGGRTTIDALWMGVPVVTLIGGTVCGRYGYSHLNRIGFPELAAHDEAEFVDIAVALASDPDRLGHYRQALRPALSASSYFDAELHVAELEEAFRVMWRRWCAEEAPAPITLSGPA